MNCRRYRSAILDFAREEKEISGELRNHFENCQACNNEFERQRHLTASLKNLRKSTERLQPSAKSEQAVLMEFARFQRKTSEGNNGWIWKLAAALVCISIGSAFVWRFRQAPPPARIVQKPAAIESHEITSGFIPLMHGELPGNSVRVVRVKLPRSSLLDLGFPVNMDRPDEMIDADVIVGEEGLPHAIRLIQQSNSVIDFQEEK